MADFNVRADSVNVEQIMEQIRARIREKRGVDYSEEQIRELARVKLEKFLDPRSVRSDLLEQYQRTQQTSPPNYAFEEDTLFETHRGPLRLIRRLLRPLLKLFFNPNPLINALHIQSQLNTMFAERENRLHLQYEVLHNLVVEMTRTSIEVKNLKMRVESLASRLEFTERRARALEGVVMYKPAPDERYVPPAPRPPEPSRAPRETAEPASAATATSQSPAVAGPDGTPEGPGQRSRRRRRRRGRRGGAPAAVTMGGDATAAEDSGAQESFEGEGGPDGDSADQADVAEPIAPEGERDQRAVRPEAFERTSGAAADSAEPVSNESSAANEPPASEEPSVSTEPSVSNEPDDQQ